MSFRPGTAQHDAAHGAFGDGKLGSNLSLDNPFGGEPSDRHDRLPSELGVATTPNILGDGDRLHMVRVDAVAHSAQMVEDQARADGASVSFVCAPMGQRRAVPPRANGAVASSVARTLPYPAPVSVDPVWRAEITNRVMSVHEAHRLAGDTPLRLPRLHREQSRLTATALAQTNKLTSAGNNRRGAGRNLIPATAATMVQPARTAIHNARIERVPRQFATATNTGLARDRGPTTVGYGQVCPMARQKSQRPMLGPAISAVGAGSEQGWFAAPTFAQLDELQPRPCTLSGHDLASLLRLESAMPRAVYQTAPGLRAALIIPLG